MMLKPLRDNARRVAVSRSTTFPAPVEGWDALSPLASMDKLRAVQLKNWFPQPGYIEVRRGYQMHAHVATATDEVETLMVWEGLTTQTLFAAAAGNIYNATAGDGVITDVTGLTSNRWQWVNFSNSGANYLYIVNGSDAPRHYNGTAWATPSITGITPSDIIHVNAHKKRLWFVLKDTTKAAYLATDAISGAATTFDLGAQFTRGGYLVAMATWTLDNGAGPDDYAVFISSRGQVAIYQGTDPASANTWAIVGVFDLPAPIGRRCFARYGANLLLVTISGVLQLNLAMREDQAQMNATAISGRITNAINAVARDYASNFGWELCVYPKGTMLILNIPTAESSTATQYVMNTLTGAWCEFDNHNANCWVVFRDRLFFGSNVGDVYEADQGSADIVTAITAVGQTAYQAPFSPGALKRVSMLQPLVVTSGTTRPSLGVSTDFVETGELSTPSGSVAAAAQWDEAVWDTNVWAGGYSYVADWTSSPALGRFISIKFQATTGSNADGCIWGTGLWGTDTWGVTNASAEDMRINGFVALMEIGGPF